MQIRTKISPGDIGHIIYLHGTFYAEEHNLDHTFEGYVASGMGEFAKAFDERKDCLWVAEDGGRIVGSIAIAGHADLTAQLRWFLVAPQARGHGLGGHLLQAALDFCREREFESVFLWTLSDLKAAAHLYRRAGFNRTEQKSHEVWGGMRTEERYDLILRNHAKTAHRSDRQRGSTDTEPGAVATGLPVTTSANEAETQPGRYRGRVKTQDATNNAESVR